MNKAFNKKRIMTFLFVSIIITLLSQIFILNIIENNNKFGKMYVINGENPHDVLYIGKPLDFRIFEGEHYNPGTVFNNTYYNYVSYINDSQRVYRILTVKFTKPSISSIDSYTVHSTPLNRGSKEYKGIASDGISFWTLEQKRFHSADGVQLIRFNLEDKIISNQTMEIENRSSLSIYDEYSRSIIGIHNNILNIHERGRSYTPPRREINRILRYDIESLKLRQVINSSFLSGVQYIFFDSEGIFWYSGEYTSLDNPNSFIGLNLTTNKIGKTIKGKWLKKPSYNIRDGQIYPYDPIIIVEKERYYGRTGETTYEPNKVIFPLEYYGYLGEEERLHGFRFYHFDKESLPTLTEKLIWFGGSIFGIGLFVYVIVDELRIVDKLRNFNQEEKEIQIRN